MEALPSLAVTGTALCRPTHQFWIRTGGQGGRCKVFWDCHMGLWTLRLVSWSSAKQGQEVILLVNDPLWLIVWAQQSQACWNLAWFLTQGLCSGRGWGCFECLYERTHSGPRNSHKNLTFAKCLMQQFSTQLLTFPRGRLQPPIL